MADAGTSGEAPITDDSTERGEFKWQSEFESKISNNCRDLVKTVDLACRVRAGFNRTEHIAIFVGRLKDSLDAFSKESLKHMRVPLDVFRRLLFFTMKEVVRHKIVLARLNVVSSKAQHRLVCELDAGFRVFFRGDIEYDMNFRTPSVQFAEESGGPDEESVDLENKGAPEEDITNPKEDYERAYQRIIDFTSQLHLEPGGSRRETAMQYRATILENLHRRLTALEWRMHS